MKRKQQRDRKLAVERYSNGEHITSIAQSMGYSRKWVYKWIERHDSSDDADGWSQSRTSSPQSRPRQLTIKIVEAVKMVASVSTTRDCFAELKRLSGSL